MLFVRSFFGFVGAALILTGCGGSGPAPEAPAAPVAPASSAPPPVDTAAPAATVPAASASPPATPEPASAPEPVVPLEDRLFASSAAFMIRYDDSAPKQPAQAACAKLESDGEAHAKCMEKERARFSADVLVFHKDDKGGMTMTIFRRQGNSLQELSKSVIALGDHLPMQVSFAVKSDHGTRPLFAGRKEVQVSGSPESTSNIEVHDPKLGKLVYETRIGLVNE